MCVCVFIHVPNDVLTVKRKSTPDFKLMTVCDWLCCGSSRKNRTQTAGKMMLLQSFLCVSCECVHGIRVWWYSLAAIDWRAYYIFWWCHQHHRYCRAYNEMCKIFSSHRIHHNVQSISKIFKQLLNRTYRTWIELCLLILTIERSEKKTNNNKKEKNKFSAIIRLMCDHKIRPFSRSHDLLVCETRKIFISNNQ